MVLPAGANGCLLSSGVLLPGAVVLSPNSCLLNMNNDTKLTLTFYRNVYMQLLFVSASTQYIS